MTGGGAVWGKKGGGGVIKHLKIDRRKKIITTKSYTHRSKS